MKKKVLAIYLTVAALCIDHGAMAADINVTALASIVTPVSIIKDAENRYGVTNGNISFGNILPGYSQGTARISSGSQSTPEVTNGVNMAGTYGSSWLIVTGDPGTKLNISFSSGNSCTLTHESHPDKHLDLIDLETASSTVTIDASGNAAFNIGGTLIIPSDALYGLYSGKYSVSIDHQ